MNLSDLTAAELAQLDKENTFVILPLGSVEQHGPHLPLGTKCFIAETVAFEAAGRLKSEGYSCLLAPTIPFMPCHTSAGFQGCFGIAARTYSDALYEIGSSLSRDGFKNLVFVNMSISPDALKAVSVAVEDLNTLRQFRAIDPMPLWTFAKNERLDAVLQGLGLESGNEIHADVKETSAMLHLDPGMMRADLASRLRSCCVNPSWEVLKGNFSFLEMGSKDGYLGSPAVANPDLGKLYIDEAAYALSEAVKFASEGNNMPELPIQIRMLLKMVDLDEM